MSRILVSGGAGFIGSHCAAAFVQAGHDVSVIDNLCNGSRGNVPREAAFYDSALTHPQVDRVVQEVAPELCFHFAAQIDVRKSCLDPIGDAQQNIIGTLALIEAGLRVGLRYFAFASSGGAIYGEAKGPQDEHHPEVPINPYGVGKLAVDKYLHAYSCQRGLKTTSMRLANVYGPRQGSAGEGGVVAHFVRRMAHGLPLLIHGDGRQTRDFIHVADVADVCLALAERQPQGVLNVGTGIETSIGALAAQVVELAKPNGCEVMHGPAIAGEQRRSVLDVRLAQATLNWRPKIALS